MPSAWLSAGRGDRGREAGQAAQRWLTASLCGYLSKGFRSDLANWPKFHAQPKPKPMANASLMDKGSGPLPASLSASLLLCFSLCVCATNPVSHTHTLTPLEPLQISCLIVCQSRNFGEERRRKEESLLSALRRGAAFPRPLSTCFDS